MKSPILINTNGVCLFICHSKTLPCKAVGMLLSILFLSCKSVFVMEFLCLTNTFLMYLCSCPCSNSLQNTWQASQSSYVWNCLVKEASFLLPCDEQGGKQPLPQGIYNKNFPVLWQNITALEMCARSAKGFTSILSERQSCSSDYDLLPLPLLQITFQNPSLRILVVNRPVSSDVPFSK